MESLEPVTSSCQDVTGFKLFSYTLVTFNLVIWSNNWFLISQGLNYCKSWEWRILMSQISLFIKYVFHSFPGVNDNSIHLQKNWELSPKTKQKLRIVTKVQTKTESLTPLDCVVTCSMRRVTLEGEDMQSDICCVAKIHLHNFLAFYAA